MAGFTSPRNFIVSELRFLLSLTSEQKTLRHREAVRQETSAPLQHLIPSVFSGASHNAEKQYTILLLRRLLLAKFELLCISSELTEDVKYSYMRMKNLLLFLEEFNSHCVGDTLERLVTAARATRDFRPISKEGQESHSIIELASLMDVYVDTRAKQLSESIYNTPSSERIIFLACHEKSLVKALLGLIATYTTLFVKGKVQTRQRKFVSEEMFDFSESVTWSNCLIPGAQSEVLWQTYNEVLRRLWSTVAEHLTAKVQPVSLEATNWEGSIQGMLKTAGLEYFPVVVNCLKHFLAAYLQQCCLIQWDTAFQKLLTATLMDYRKGYRRLNSSHTDLYRQTLHPLDKHMSGQSKALGHASTEVDASIVAHLCILRHALLVACAVKASLDHLTFSLLQNISTSLCCLNLTVLARMLFRELPPIRCALKRSVTLSYDATSPRVLLPTFARPHILESSCIDVCSSLHMTSTCLQERVEEFYKSFQTQWASRCAKMLNSSFPHTRYWKNLREYGEIDAYQLEPSSYCEQVAHQLLLPMVGAAVKLPPEEQKNFLYLMTMVFCQEYRKIVTSNKKLYSIFAGRQLLSDYRYLRRCLTSPDHQLAKSSLMVLSRLPVLVEVEKGLLSICNCGMSEEDETNTSPEPERTSDVSLPSSNFPVLVQTAWNSPRDWLNCLLY